MQITKGDEADAMHSARAICLANRPNLDPIRPLQRRKIAADTNFHIVKEIPDSRT
jgi:hypothetical protein